MSTKLNLHLKPTAPADLACYSIYQQLLIIMQDNEQGVIAATDSKFLHDYRIAVRKTRSGLSQLRDVLPKDVRHHYADFFAWLGTVTTPVRDLDVYLAHFFDYQNSLPLALQADLQPLQDFLHSKRQQAHDELVAALQSEHYRSTLSAWQQYLNEPPQSLFDMSIKELADQQLQKNHKNVRQKGKAISPQSPDCVLHDLRKSCKKLRYLIEFFQSLYGKSEIKPLLSKLKILQDVLGDFQDCAVQEQQLTLFRGELAAQAVPANTVLALSALIEKLHSRKQQARDDFADVFATFKKNKKLNF